MCECCERASLRSNIFSKEFILSLCVSSRSCWAFLCVYLYPISIIQTERVRLFAFFFWKTYTKYLACECCLRQSLSYFPFLVHCECECVHFRIGNLLILFKHAINAGGFSLQIGYCEWNFSRSTWTQYVYIRTASTMPDSQIHRTRKNKNKCRFESVTWRNKNLCCVFRSNKT